MKHTELFEKNREALEKAIAEAYVYSLQYGEPCSVYIWSDGEVETLEGTWTLVPRECEPRTVETVYVAREWKDFDESEETVEEWKERVRKYLTDGKLQEIWDEVYGEAEYEDEMETFEHVFDLKRKVRRFEFTYSESKGFIEETELEPMDIHDLLEAIEDLPEYDFDGTRAYLNEATYKAVQMCDDEEQLEKALVFWNESKEDGSDFTELMTWCQEVYNKDLIKNS